MVPTALLICFLLSQWFRYAHPRNIHLIIIRTGGIKTAKPQSRNCFARNPGKECCKNIISVCGARPHRHRTLTHTNIQTRTFHFPEISQNFCGALLGPAYLPPHTTFCHKYKYSRRGVLSQPSFLPGVFICFILIITASTPKGHTCKRKCK